MSKGSLNSVLKFLRAVKPDAHTVGVINGDSIDCEGFDEAAFFLDAGTIATSVDMKLQEADEDPLVPDTAGVFADLSPTAAAITQLTVTDDQAIIRVNLMNRKRFLRAVLTAGGTEDVAIMCVLANFKYNPVSQPSGVEVVDANA